MSKRFIINFFVPGIPATAGSKRPFIYKSKKDGKQRVAMTPDNKRQKPWMSDVKYYAQKEYPYNPVVCPVMLHLIFTMPRPKSHYGTGRNSETLKASAPSWPTVKPDLTKMLRAVEDALKGVVWKDDSQVVSQVTLKRYGDRPGVDVMIKNYNYREGEIVIK